MYAPSMSPIRRSTRNAKGADRRQCSPVKNRIMSPGTGGDLDFLRKGVDDHRQTVRTARSALASTLDRLGEYHVKQKHYDDAMDAFTEALHEKRSVFSQLVPSFMNCGSAERCRLNSSESSDTLFDLDKLEPEIRDLHDHTIDDIVKTLKNMGNVHSLRGEQDEAMRYYTEVTSLRRTRTSFHRESSGASIGSKSKSTRSDFWGDEDTSTLMSEINEDVKALDDLFRSISFRNGDGSASNDAKECPPTPNTPAESGSNAKSRSSTDKSKKRRRRNGLRENGAENEPFRRSSSLGSRDNELREALDAYKSVISIENSPNSEQWDETLNSFTLRANLLHEIIHKKSDKSPPTDLPEGHPTRIAELQLALEIYREVLQVQQQLSMAPGDSEPQASAKIASTMIRMGSLCYKLNNFDEELRMYEEANHVYRRTFGDNHAYVAGTYKNIGMVMAERGEYDEAMSHFENARKIYLDVNHGDEMNNDVASAISCMGNVKNRMGELDEALSHYMQALVIYRRIRELEGGPKETSTRDVTATLKIIGMVFTKKGELSTAMEHYSEALSLLRTSGIIKTNAGKESLASILSRIASIHFKKGEYDEAMTLYREAYDLTVQLRSMNHPEVAGILHYIGGIHHKRGEYADAMDCYQEAVRVYHSTLGPGHSAVAATLVCIGSLHYKKRNLDSAMMFYREAFRLNRDAYGLHHPDVAPTLKSIGTILTKQGEYDEAWGVFRDVLSIKCTLHGTDHPEVANAYKSLGNIHYKRGELADAERQYRHALNIYRRTKGEDHPDTGSARTSIEHIRYWMRERGNNRDTNSNSKLEQREPSSSTRSASRGGGHHHGASAIPPPCPDELSC